MGFVAEIYVAEGAGQPMRTLTEIRALSGLGLEGDRYATASGSFSRWPDSGRAVTLIASETLTAIRAESGLDLTAGRTRRNLVTTGVDLAPLNGKKFRIGTALFRGSRLAAPCRYLERRTAVGVYEVLKGRGGLRADILEGGIIRVGDVVELIP